MRERESVTIQDTSTNANHATTGIVCGVLTSNNKGELQYINNQLSEDPMRLHGKPVRCKESEPYLGFTLHEKGVKASINTTVKLRID